MMEAVHLHLGIWLYHNSTGWAYGQSREFFYSKKVESELPVISQQTDPQSPCI